MTTAIFTTTDIYPALDTVAADMLQLLNTFSEDQLNQAPGAGNWTAAQVAVHITKSNASIVRALSAAGKPSDREGDENIPKLKAILLDFSTKMSAPEFIKPIIQHYPKEVILKDLQYSFELVKAMSYEVDLSEVVPFPVMRELSKFEILHFIQFHVMRHNHQLRKIASSLPPYSSIKTNAVMPTRKEIIQQVNDSFMQGNIEGFLVYCTDDFRWTVVGSPTMVGKQHVLHFMKSMNSTNAPILHIEKTIMDGDTGVCTGMMQMKNREGGITESAFCDVYDFDGDKIRALHSYIIDIKK